MYPHTPVGSCQVSEHSQHQSLHVHLVLCAHLVRPFGPPNHGLLFQEMCFLLKKTDRVGTLGRKISHHQSAQIESGKYYSFATVPMLVK